MQTWCPMGAVNSSLFSISTLFLASGADLKAFMLMPDNSQDRENFGEYLELT